MLTSYHPSCTHFANSVYSKPLRPIVLFTSSISLIWSLVLGVRFFQDRGEGIETSRMSIFGLILSILFFVIAGIELFGTVAAITQKIVLTRIYFILSGLVAIVTFAAELIRVIAHFLIKKDLINSCVNQVTGSKAETLSGAIASIDSGEAQRLCEEDWQRGIWWDIGWLLLTTCLALLFAGLAGAYYHQLLDPSFTRTSSSPLDRSSDMIPMGPYNMASPSPYHPHHQADLPFVPPKYAPPPPEYHAPPYAPPSLDNTRGDFPLTTGGGEKHLGLVDGLERVSLSDDHRPLAPR